MLRHGSSFRGASLRKLLLIGIVRNQSRKVLVQVGLSEVSARWVGAGGSCMLQKGDRVSAGKAAAGPHSTSLRDSPAPAGPSG